MLCYNCFREKEYTGPCPHCGFDPAESAGKYPLALRPGSILNGRYIVGRVLGQGGFGITYIALDDRTKSRVAIKEYLPTEFAGRTAGTNRVQAYSGNREENFTFGKTRFLEEAKTLAAFIGDEHIVRIHSYFEENGTAYFSMEYVEGQPLDKYMASKGGRLTVEEANELLLPLMEALGHVHARGIVHRDIAPDNIIVQPNGQAKLIDFGAARYSTGEKSKSLDVVIKHGFAPSEQYMRRGRQGPFTDVYAMGATYYYAITGKVPPDAVERVTDHVDLILPRTLGARISDKAQKALLKALDVTAANRYQTMGEFRAELGAEADKNREKKRQKQEKDAERQRLREENKARKEKDKAARREKAAAPAEESSPSPVPGPKKSRWPVIAIPAALICLALVVVFSRGGPAKEKAPAVTAAPTAAVIADPTSRPTQAPASVPTEAPAVQPTQAPTAAPTEAPAAQPTQTPGNEVSVFESDSVSVGDYITFGRYEQDNDTANGPEPVEWLVLDVQGEQALVISRYALDCQPYNSSNTSVTWETCSLRKWLNGVFLDTAFTPEEQARIPAVTVCADKNPRYNIGPGNDTMDQVFLLSIAEASNCFSSNNGRQCLGTAFCFSQGASNVGDSSCWWCLRTRGRGSSHVASVNRDGSIDYDGCDVSSGAFAVRPALWINMAENSPAITADPTETPAAQPTQTPGDEVSVFEPDSVSVGDYITFGRYEQDNDLTNGPEPVEWLVLDVQDERALVISRYGLDCQPYNSSFTSVTWETCSLRQWLNGSFLDTAFTLEEQARIPAMIISADKNPRYDTDPGNDTTDQVFLLSIDEAVKFFDSGSASICSATAYARWRGSSRTCWWWLRSPGYHSNCAAYVNNGGSVSNSGGSVFDDDIAVRPALWINLNS